MHGRSITTWLAVLGCTTTVIAQQTWVVDAAGGGDFSDLPEAVAAAAPGDLLILRRGDYTGEVLRRGLRIRGEPGARVVRQDFSVEALPSGEHCTVTGITFETPVTVVSCDGTVHFEASTMRGAHHMWGIVGGWCVLLAHARAVTIRGCEIRGRHGAQCNGILCLASAVALWESDVAGSWPTPDSGFNQGRIPGYTGIYAVESVLSLRNCAIRSGGDGIQWVNWTPIHLPGRPAIEAHDSSIHVSGVVPKMFVGGSSGSDLYMLRGALIHDPRAGLPRSEFLLDRCSEQQRPVDHVEAAQTGAAITITIVAPAGASSLLVGSQPAAAAWLPTIGTSWLDLGSVVGLGLFHHASGGIGTSVPLPPIAPAGTALAFQAFVVQPTRAELSEPAVVVLR